ncbi:hypothetical protein AGMMS50262_04100 [Bacteroidia bacterium]|nr:hypothetical protein AGMMS50262_04100 [Bacteroidia bacterium]
MRNRYFKLISCAALFSILILQGIWLWNTYTLHKTELKRDVWQSFVTSLQKEALDRVNNPEKKGQWKQQEIWGILLENDSILSNIITLNDYLYREEEPFSIENADSILKPKFTGLFVRDYDLSVVNLEGKTIKRMTHGSKNAEKLSFKEKIQICSINSEFVIVSISSPYKAIFRQMLLLLIGSILLAIIIVYCIFLQITIIVRQDKIAKLRCDFTHAMIHDMKNPITAILMGLNNLKSGKLDDKPQMKEQYYRLMTKEGENILGLANKILTIAQLEEKKLTLSKQLIPLADLIDALIVKYRLNTLKKIEFQVELNEVENIYADYEHIFETFGNIIDNAIKYSKEEVYIHISADTQGNHKRISFRDNGIGISAKDRKKIFEKFERGSFVAKERKAGGFGLGLNYVYQVVTAHEGKIELESKIGHYSKFTIYLPYDDKIVAH